MAVPPGPGSNPGVAAPTCFRHPGRETYVSCVRCGRPACPDCLRSAAVGQQCVDCIKAANRGTRQPTGAFGGRVTGTPVVTYTLVGLCVLAYLAELVYPKTVDYGELIGGAYDPTIHAVVGVGVGDWYRLLTSAFLHEPPGSGIGLAHIIFNMWALIVVGPSLERMLGRLKFLSVYLVSALAGAVLYYIIVKPYDPALGASGAIFGLFGAWFVLSRRLRLDARMIVGLIVINLVISFAVAGIAWEDHVGGLIAGGLLTAAYVYAPRSYRKLVGISSTVLILAILVIGIVLRDQNLVGTVIIRF
jgi:membrane associated rhomboid family serine protease